MNKAKLAVVALFGAVTFVAGADQVVYPCPKEPHHHHYDGSIHIGGNCVGIKECNGQPEKVVVVEKVVVKEPEPVVYREVVVAPPPPPRPWFTLDLCLGHKHHHPAPPPRHHPAPRPLPPAPHHHHR